MISRWKNLTSVQRGELNRLFQLNRRVFKAYLLKESLEQLWDYRYEGAMLNYLRKWIDQLRTAICRSRPFEHPLVPLRDVVEVPPANARTPAFSRAGRHGQPPALAE